MRSSATRSPIRHFRPATRSTSSSASSDAPASVLSSQLEVPSPFDVGRSVDLEHRDRDFADATVFDLAKANAVAVGPDHFAFTEVEVVHRVAELGVGLHFDERLVDALRHHGGLEL